MTEEEYFASMDGIYCIYMVTFAKDDKLERRLAGRVQVADGMLLILEDTDSHPLGSIFSNGAFEGRNRQRLVFLHFNGYWQVIRETNKDEPGDDWPSSSSV